MRVAGRAAGATLVLTITDTTLGIINAILADPRIDHDTANPPASK